MYYMLTRNCSIVSAVLQHHQKWLTMSFNQLRRIDCPLILAALKRQTQGETIQLNYNALNVLED